MKIDYRPVHGFTLTDDTTDSPHGTGINIALGGAVSMFTVGAVNSLANVRAVLDSGANLCNGVPPTPAQVQLAQMRVKGM